MNIPEWIKPAVYGAVVGGVAVAIVGFSWGGWVTGGTAAQNAADAAAQGRTDLAAAICVQNFMADENARENLANLNETSSSIRQREIIEEGGWAMMPNQDEAARATMTLCARMISEIDPSELPVVEDGDVVEPGAVEEPALTEDEADDATAQ
ncbi:hypothetical protein [Pelagibacterium halotolerans]|uniref:hypothetical protein n=1 Tax=Pelagibacterium halotolerans TaxID=531813 RepID=UPI003850C69D